jgi:hypothetical protein
LRYRPGLIRASLVLAMIASSLPATSAHANPSKGPLGASVLIECSIPLDHFPQPVKTPNSNTCSGIATGVFGGLKSNAGGGAVVGVAAASPVSITAQYFEPCLLGALGFSNGVGAAASIVVEDVTKGGNVIMRNNGLYRFPDDWVRVGAVALITTGKMIPNVNFPKKGVQSILTWGFTGQAMDAVGGLGLGVIIPESIPDTACPGAAMTLQVIAVIQSL